MAFDLKTFGNKLQRSRKQLQLEIQDVAQKTGIIEKKIVELENGNIEPTGDEVLIFADFYKQSYNYFISNQQKSSSEQIDILYRQFGNDFSKEDRWAIQEFIYLCECEQQVFNLIGFEKAQFNYEPQGTFYKAHGEQGAIELRKALMLNDDSLILNPYLTFRRLGIHIFRRKLNNSNISGLFINHPWAGKCILVNYSEDIFRQNFTLAHEVGHSIFDYRENINISFELESARELKEVRANTFASNFLITKAIFRKFNASNWNEKHLISVAQQLQVNIEPLLIAIKNSGIDLPNYKSLKTIKIPKASKIDPELRGLSETRFETKKTLLEKGLSEFYVTNLYTAYERGLVSAGKLADCLLCNEKELRDTLEMFKLKLSYGN